MENLLAARSQMALSLGFHIIFAVIGMVMPWFMAVSHLKWLRTGEEAWLGLTKAWSKGVAIFFVVGAVSGTVLSFELGLLWPGFMEHAGPIIGMPFSLEGTAFFLEAIALGLYLYGWKYLPKWVHWGSGVMVGITGVASGVLVVAANGWMNAPSGFTYENGVFSGIDPIAAMLNPAWGSQALHMVLAAFASVGFGVAGLHAFLLYRNPGHAVHRRAVKVALLFGLVAALLQPLSGDIAAKDIAERQPEKLAAMEALFETEQPASLLIGGIPDEKTGTVKYGIHIPAALSFLAHGDFSAEVKGLNEFPKENHPPVAIVHFAFQIMVGIGFLLMAIGVLYLFMLWRKREPLSKNWFLKLLAFSTPLGFLALEAGWVVTEVGRQPWIIYKVMRTAEAVTPMTGLQYQLGLFALVYLLLAVAVTVLLRRHIRKLDRNPLAYSSPS